MTYLFEKRKISLADPITLGYISVSPTKMDPKYITNLHHKVQGLNFTQS